jgi:hypothetical protein
MFAGPVYALGDKRKGPAEVGGSFLFGLRVGYGT